VNDFYFKYLLFISFYFLMTIKGLLINFILKTSIFNMLFDLFHELTIYNLFAVFVNHKELKFLSRPTAKYFRLVLINSVNY
jgi:hypothetical protein